MIIETTDNRFYLVADFKTGVYDHLWLGIRVKRVKDAYVPRAKAKEELVRREGSRVVEQPISWAPEVFLEGKWSRNGLRFATEAEAKSNAYALLMRWFVPTDSRASPADEAPNYRWIDGKLETIDEARCS